MALVIRHLPGKLQELSRNIQDYSVTHKIDKLVQQANEVAHCVTHAFSVSGNDVLQQKKKLSKVRCPSKVEIEILSQTLIAFKGDVNNCFGKALAMKTSINDFIEICRGKNKLKNREIEEAKIEISGLDRQIRLAEQDIRKYEDDARNEERGAEELENRSRDLRRESERHREKGAIWGFISIDVGLVFAPFTGGASLVPALASAGIGVAVNLDNANDCDRTAAKLRVSAEDKKAKARRQREMKQEFESKKIAKTNELKSRKEMVENLSRTCDGLIELQRHLQASVSGFERAIYIVQDFQNAIHLTVLQGDAFVLLKEVFMECPEEFHDEAHEGLYDLKVKWTQLEQLFLSNSDHRGIAF
ncbi:uncharacterized protein LOC123547074 [Mercenaria mercenaria]|uniref:uncharacterized protein LOC123547074 n=1 Tax=Mercenaria mercenaria TaxID=6596 RepID=UPI00234E54FB|nr:uncharacterized protein LOC123547074 [Mercenaria mercenaria]